MAAVTAPLCARSSSQGTKVVARRSRPCDLAMTSGPRCREAVVRAPEHRPSVSYLPETSPAVGRPGVRVAVRGRGRAMAEWPAQGGPERRARGCGLYARAAASGPSRTPTGRPARAAAVFGPKRPGASSTSTTSHQGVQPPHERVVSPKHSREHSHDGLILGGKFS